MPLASIIIPTNRPPEVVEPCLRALATQSVGGQELEVIVVFNGVAATPAWPPRTWPFELIVDWSDEANIGAAKNVALDHARAPWVVLLNDDVVPAPDFIAAHLAAHHRVSRPAMVAGESVWRRYFDETVFDRLIQTTSMVFFYDQMRPHAWYGFRHAWNLNLSLPRRYCATVRFDERLKPVNFDDLEWAFRVEREHGLKVWYAPEARLIHDHRYTLTGYLQRERHLGAMAALLWYCNPACYRAIYGADLDQAYRDYCRRYVDQEGRCEADLCRRLAAISARRPDELGPVPEVQDEVVQALYYAHLPLKRLAFRGGLLEAAARANSAPASDHSIRVKAGVPANT